MFENNAIYIVNGLLIEKQFLFITVLIEEYFIQILLKDTFYELNFVHLL